MKALKRIYFAAPATILVMPLLAQAEPTPNFGLIGQSFNNVVTFINSVLVPAVFALALLLFIWGMYVHFIQGGADEGKRDEGKKLALYAIAGFVLMVSIWGIVNLVAGGLGLRSNNITDKIPDVPFSLPGGG